MESYRLYSTGVSYETHSQKTASLVARRCDTGAVIEDRGVLRRSREAAEEDGHPARRKLSDFPANA